MSYPRHCRGVSDRVSDQVSDRVSDYEWTMRPDGVNFATPTKRGSDRVRDRVKTTTGTREKNTSDVNVPPDFSLSLHEPMGVSVPLQKSRSGARSGGVGREQDHLTGDVISAPKSLQDFVETKKSPAVSTGEQILAEFSSTASGRCRPSSSYLYCARHEHDDVEGMGYVDDIEQRVAHDAPLEAVRVMCLSDMSKSDIETLTSSLWIPCKYDLRTRKVLWHTRNRAARLKSRCGESCQSYFNAETWTVVLNETVLDLQLRKQQSTRRSDMKIWTICYQSRSKPNDVHWDPENIQYDVDIVPFFVCDYGTEEEKVTWYLPSANDGPYLIQNSDEMILSCNFVSSDGLGVLSHSPSRCRLGGIKHHSKIFHTSSPPLPASTSVNYRPEVSLPLPSASSSSIVESYGFLSHGHMNRNGEGDSDGDGNDGGGDFKALNDCCDDNKVNSSSRYESDCDLFHSLTHLKSCGDVLALEEALGSCLNTLVSENGNMKTSQHNEWSEIARRDDFRLLKELNYLMGCCGPKTIEETFDLCRTSSHCLLILAQICPLEFKRFIYWRCNENSSQLSCACCGCNQKSGDFIRREGGGASSNVVKNLYDYFMLPFAQLLTALLEGTSSLSSDYVKLDFSSPSVNWNSECIMDKAVSDRQVYMVECLPALTAMSSLLLTAFTTSHFDAPKEELPSTRGEVSYVCRRCSSHGKDVRHFISQVDEDNDGKKSAGEFLSLLQWALELSFKTSKLPPPSKAHEADQLASLHKTLDEIACALCLACTPLFPGILVWLQPHEAQQSEVLPATKIVTAGVVLLSFLRKNDCLPVSTKSQQCEMHLFVRSIFVSLCNCASLALKSFLTEGGIKCQDTKQLEACLYNGSDVDLIEMALSLPKALISVNGLLCLLKEQQADEVVDDLAWDIVPNSLLFMIAAQRTRPDCLVNSLFILVPSSWFMAVLVDIVELLDLLLFTFKWYEIKSTYDAKEAILQSLESCVETVEVFRESQYEYFTESFLSSYSTSIIKLLSKCYESS